MQKIPTVFKRNYDTDRLVRDEVVDGCDWVLYGEGIATRKWDGSCCAIIGDVFHKRLEVKAGKPAPPGFIPMQEADEVTGGVPGWVKVGDGTEDKWFRIAFDQTVLAWGDCDGTYEAVGPHFGGGHHKKNPEGSIDMLIRHGKHVMDFPRDFASIRRYFETMGNVSHGPSIEGVVFHHPDGRMAKIKARDFGLTR